MMTGQAVVSGGQVILEHVSREDGGRYVCWDTLGKAGEEVMQQVKLDAVGPFDNSPSTD